MPLGPKFHVKVAYWRRNSFVYLYCVPNVHQKGFPVLAVSVVSVNLPIFAVAYMTFYNFYRPRMPQFSRIPQIVSHPSLTALSFVDPSQTKSNSFRSYQHWPLRIV
uniref:Uncharacterized protein n=1 Tax=Glossina pallidipes TaxID=7398 RepID=A0A1A9Z5P3_GLOPL